jgi:hypothetical protein
MLGNGCLVCIHGFHMHTCNYIAVNVLKTMNAIKKAQWVGEFCDHISYHTTDIVL